MNRLVLCSTFALVASAVQAPAFAQVVPPQSIAAGQTIESALQSDAPRLEDGVPFGCYAIETAPGDRVAVVLHSQSFYPVVRIARGALCSASALQQESDPANASSEARVEFAAAGGRYLILARATAPNASGHYALSVEGATTVKSERIATTNTDAERQRIMQHEIAQRQAQLAAEAARQRREAEAAREAREFERMLAAQQAEEDAYYQDDFDDYAEPQTNPMAGVMDAFVGGFNSEMQKQRQMQAQFDETNRMIGRLQAEERRRQESERRAAEAERARAAADQRMAQAQMAAQRAEAAAQSAQRAQATARAPAVAPPAAPAAMVSRTPSGSSLGTTRAPRPSANCPTVTEIRDARSTPFSTKERAMHQLMTVPRPHGSELFDIKCDQIGNGRMFWTCWGKYQATYERCTGASRQ